MTGHFRKLLDRALVVYRRATLRLWKKNQRTSSKSGKSGKDEACRLSKKFLQTTTSQRMMHQLSNTKEVFVVIVNLFCVKSVFKANLLHQSVAKIHTLHVVVVLKYLF